jgi:HK97 family phage major capsid protein
MRTIADIQAKKNKLIADATELLNRGLSTPEIRASYKKLLSQADDAQHDLDVLMRVERAFPYAAPALATKPAPAVIEVIPESKERRQAKLNASARHFFRHGLRPNAPEQRALLTTSDAAGGALVAQAFDEAFVEASKFFGPIWNLIHRKDSEKGEPTKFVVSDSTNQTFSLVSEGTTSASSVAEQPTIFSDVASTDTLVSSFIYSVQELDEAFDLTEFLTRNAGLAVSRARETAVTLGITNDGTSTALPSSPTGGLLAGVSAGVTQTSGTLAAGVTYAQLSTLAGSVDRSYYETGAFMASPSVESFLKAQVSTTGKPLYKVGDDGLLVIQGRKLFPNAAMSPAGTASKPLVLFGDYSRFYSVLNTGVRIKVISNDDGSPALSYLTREMIVYTRIGATTGVSTSVKALVSAAS